MALKGRPDAAECFAPMCLVFSLQNLFGIVAPNGVPVERHHSGVPVVDPSLPERDRSGRV